MPGSREGKTEKRFISQNSPHSTHSSLPRLFAFPRTCSILSHLRAFEHTVLPLKPHFIHLFLRAAFTTAHAAGPSCSFCPVSLSSLVLLYFISQNFLLPETILFVVITCCYNQLSLDSSLLESMRTDIAFTFILFFFDISFSKDTAAGTEQEETSIKR